VVPRTEDMLRADGLLKSSHVAFFDPDFLDWLEATFLIDEVGLEPERNAGVEDHRHGRQSDADGLLKSSHVAFCDPDFLDWLEATFLLGEVRLQPERNTGVEDHRHGRQSNASSYDKKLAETLNRFSGVIFALSSTMITLAEAISWSSSRALINEWRVDMVPNKRSSITKQV
jgi:hypothetical protein